MKKELQRIQSIRSLWYLTQKKKFHYEIRQQTSLAKNITRRLKLRRNRLISSEKDRGSKFFKWLIIICTHIGPTKGLQFSSKRSKESLISKLTKSQQTEIKTNICAFADSWIEKHCVSSESYWKHCVCNVTHFFDIFRKVKGLWDSALVGLTAQKLLLLNDPRYYFAL